MSVLTALDYAAVLVFALTGALAASRAQLDLIGFAFLASLTALGGGTVRDLLLDRNPVFWIADPMPLAIACAAAVLVFFTAHLLESRQRVLTWLDALALPIAVAAGVRAATETGQSVPIILIMGITTGCFGGFCATSSPMRCRCLFARASYTSPPPWLAEVRRSSPMRFGPPRCCRWWPVW